MSLEQSNKYILGQCEQKIESEGIVCINLVFKDIAQNSDPELARGVDPEDHIRILYIGAKLVLNPKYRYCRVIPYLFEGSANVWIELNPDYALMQSNLALNESNKKANELLGEQDKFLRRNSRMMLYAAICSAFFSFAVVIVAILDFSSRETVQSNNESNSEHFTSTMNGSGSTAECLKLDNTAETPALDTVQLLKDSNSIKQLLKRPGAL